MTPHERLRANVRDRRIELGMTQRELSEVTGYTQANLSRLENGMGNPRLKTIVTALTKGI